MLGDHIISNFDIPKIHALVVAAGVGSRFGGRLPKQYSRIGNKTVLEYSINALAGHTLIDKCTLVIGDNDKIAHTLAFCLPVQMVLGGAERWQSVANGVYQIAKTANLGDLVLIHDAARPCLAHSDLNKVIESAINEPYGAILAVPVADTLKQQDERENIASTIPRQGLWQAQTPQVYRLRHLLTAIEFIKKNTTIAITDEAMAFELLGLPIKLVQGSRSNLKLTFGDELPLISAILANRQ